MWQAIVRLGRLLNWAFAVALLLALLWLFWLSDPRPGPFLEQTATLALFIAIPVGIFFIVRYGLGRFVRGMANASAMRRRGQRFGAFLRKFR